MVARNIADCVEPPKPKKYKAKFLDDKQTNLLIEKVEKGRSFRTKLAKCKSWKEIYKSGARTIMHKARFENIATKNQ